MTARILAVVIALIVMLAVLWMLRSRGLREKYAILWLVVGFIVLLAAAVPGWVERLSSALGIQTPSNLLLLGGMTVLFFIALQLSAEVGRLEEEARVLAEEVAMLRLAHRTQQDQIDLLMADRGAEQRSLRLRDPAEVPNPNTSMTAIRPERSE